MKHLPIFLLIVMLCIVSCEEDEIPDTDYRQEMRDFVISISEYAKSTEQNFMIIPQNGTDLIFDNPDTRSGLNLAYLDAIDGYGQEDLFYGYEYENEPTPIDETTWLQTNLQTIKNQGKPILVTDYCSAPVKVDDSYERNNAAGYISFAALNTELRDIPGYPDTIYNENDQDITTLSQVHNFLYLLNTENFETKETFLDSLSKTNYDLIITDLCFHDCTIFTKEQITQLKTKANGGKRLVVCYMSIGEAEDYRYYWSPQWNEYLPEFIFEENPEWEGNYKVRYWVDNWKEIIYGVESSYMHRILVAGFDGAYLDIIDAYEYFE